MVIDGSQILPTLGGLAASSVGAVGVALWGKRLEAWSESRTSEGESALFFPGWWRVLCPMAAGLFGTLLWFGFMDRALAFVAVALLLVASSWLAIQAGRSVILDAQGLRERGWFGAQAFVAWDDVTSVHYSSVWDRVRLVGSKGQVIRVWRMMRGREHFVAAVQDRLRLHELLGRSLRGWGPPT